MDLIVVVLNEGNGFVCAHQRNAPGAKWFAPGEFQSAVKRERKIKMCGR